MGIGINGEKLFNRANKCFAIENGTVAGKFKRPVPQLNVFLFNGVRKFIFISLLACHFLDAIIVLLSS